MHCMNTHCEFGKYFCEEIKSIYFQEEKNDYYFLRVQEFWKSNSVFDLM